MTNNKEVLTIEQVAHIPADNKLEAIVRVSKIETVSKEGTMMGFLNELKNIVEQQKQLEKMKHDVIHVIASVAVAQDYSDAEIEQIKNAIFLDEKTKKLLLKKIKATADNLKMQKLVKINGKLEKRTFIEKDVEDEKTKKK